MNEVLFVSALAFDSLGHLLICQMPLMKLFALCLMFICFLRERNACLTHPDRSAMAGLLLQKMFHPEGCSSPVGKAQEQMPCWQCIAEDSEKTPGIDSVDRFQQKTVMNFQINTTRTFNLNPESFPCYFYFLIFLAHCFKFNAFVFILFMETCLYQRIILAILLAFTSLFTQSISYFVFKIIKRKLPQSEANRHIRFSYIRSFFLF